jgi:putative ABC transport system permease protein
MSIPGIKKKNVAPLNDTKSWLDSFAYKTPLSWWIFGLSGIIALGIAILTVSLQTWRVATKNPVEALRYE